MNNNFKDAITAAIGFCFIILVLSFSAYKQERHEIQDTLSCDSVINQIKREYYQCRESLMKLAEEKAQLRKDTSDKSALIRKMAKYIKPKEMEKIIKQ